MLNPLDYFDEYGFPTKPVSFATLQALDGTARDFYNEIFVDRIGDPDLLRQVFRDFADERGWSELDRRLVASVLYENYGVDGIKVFSE
ncbi:MAG TPA: hypothetical protein VNU93_05455 [Verrucomicrobiae bacterium]|nr:hypothetical protein [Verrucomicrobiae bacterium]